MKCSTCGEEHELLDPVFSRPDVIFAMSPTEKQGRVLENNDLCALRDDARGHRYFVRCTLPVLLLDAPGRSCWGLWAEVSEEDSVVIWNAWRDPDQNRITPMQARIANRIPGYPDTTGLPVRLQLTGPTTRPELTVPADSIHPFARECIAGVCTHRVMDWLNSMSRGAG